MSLLAIAGLSEQSMPEAWHRLTLRPRPRIPLSMFFGREKLLAIDAAKRLDDLRVPPGNRLEALRGERYGQHSIRTNDQWLQVPLRTD